MPPIPIKQLKRDGSNIKQWQMQLNAYADSKDYTEWLTTSNYPACAVVQQVDAQGNPIPFTTEEQTAINSYKAAFSIWRKADGELRGAILNTVDPFFLDQLEGCSSARHMVQHLVGLYAQLGISTVISCWKQFVDYRYDGSLKIVDFCGNWTTYYKDLNRHEIGVSETVAVLQFLIAIEAYDPDFTRRQRERIRKRERLEVFTLITEICDESIAKNQEVVLAAAFKAPRAKANTTKSNKCSECKRKHPGGPEKCWKTHPELRPEWWKDPAEQEVSKKANAAIVQKRDESDYSKFCMAAAAHTTNSYAGPTADAANTARTIDAGLSQKLMSFASDRTLRKTWILDTGSTVHICNDRTRFTTLKKSTNLITTGGADVKILGYGTVSLYVLRQDGTVMELEVSN
ncbi:uncharacterized protein BDZ99DRAFT_483879, partial [Mytilinidion resinicola]